MTPSSASTSASRCFAREHGGVRTQAPGIGKFLNEFVFQTVVCPRLQREPCRRTE